MPLYSCTSISSECCAWEFEYFVWVLSLRVLVLRLNVVPESSSTSPECCACELECFVWVVCLQVRVLRLSVVPVSSSASSECCACELECFVWVLCLRVRVLRLSVVPPSSSASSEYVSWEFASEWLRNGTTYIYLSVLFIKLYIYRLVVLHVATFVTCN